MIQLTTRLQELLSSNSIEVFYLLKLGDEYTTTYYRDVVFNGSTYLANNRILALDAPQVNSIVDREQYKITLADPGFDLGAQVSGVVAGKGLVGTPVELRSAFVDQTNSLPELAPANTFIVYKGLIDAGAYQIKTSEQGEVLLTISCVSPIADLDAVKTIYTSKEYARRRNPNDTAFDQIYLGSGVINLKWGRT